MKIFFSVLITVGVSIGMFSQDKKVRFGLKGGLNLATMTVKSDIYQINDIQSKIGYQMGTFLKVPLSERFAFQPEIFFTTQKYSYTVQISVVDSFSKSLSGDISYILIPLMVTFHPIDRFGIEFGPQIGFLVKHKAEITTEIEDFFEPNQHISVTRNYDFLSKSNSQETSVNAGFSFELTDNLAISGRYSYSLDSLIKEVDGVEFYSATLEGKNVFQFNLAIMF